MLTVIVIGAGINGVVAAIELKRRGHRVTVIEAGPVPHPLAASTDISKAIRSCYGSDEDYTEMAERSVMRWREWNDLFGAKLFHEVGTMFLRQETMKPGDFEYETFHLLGKRRHDVERITPERLRERFPAWNAERFRDGVFDPEGGYAESGRTVSALCQWAESLGIEIRTGARFRELDQTTSESVKGVVLDGGDRMSAEVVVAATGAWTPQALPFTQQFFRATGHPLFHLQPNDRSLFAPERFPMFGADITTTGYYGFPLGREGVVKIGIHGPGREMSPDSPERITTTEQEAELRGFLSWAFPTLAGAPIVHTRICLYCDTNDGNFWIAEDPDRAGLFIAAGDSGHGFKFAPILGELISDAVERKDNRLLEKFRWRPEVRPGEAREAARFLPKT